MIQGEQLVDRIAPKDCDVVDVVDVATSLWRCINGPQDGSEQNYPNFNNNNQKGLFNGDNQSSMLKPSITVINGPTSFIRLLRN